MHRPPQAPPVTQRRGAKAYRITRGAQTGCFYGLAIRAISSMVLNSSMPFVQRASPSSCIWPLALKSFWLRKLFATQRNRPPAVYCVNEYRTSLSAMARFECLKMAEGMRIVAPGGNSMMSFNSQRTRWPPRVGS